MSNVIENEPPLHVFRLDPMESTPFADDGQLDGLGIKIVDDIGSAELIVSRRKKLFTPDNVHLGSTHVLWTHEPFFDFTTSVVDFMTSRGTTIPLFAFNVHNGQIYTDNFYYGPIGRPLALIEREDDLNVEFDNKVVTFAASFKNFQSSIDGKNISLYGVRQELALDLHKQGKVRLIGRGWPDGVAETESRYGDQARSQNTLESKLAFLRQSNMTLAYENCVADYYVTEKIWQGIQGGCLPIYYANSTIYQTFPPDSFIDGSLFESAEALVNFIGAITIDEYIRRTNLCRKTYNYALSKRFRNVSRQRSSQRLKRFIDALRACPTPRKAVNADGVEA